MNRITTQRIAVMECGRYLMDLRALVDELEAQGLPPHAWITDADVEGSNLVISFKVDQPRTDDVPLLEQLYHERYGVASS